MLTRYKEKENILRLIPGYKHKIDPVDNCPS